MSWISRIRHYSLVAALLLAVLACNLQVGLPTPQGAAAPGVAVQPTAPPTAPFTGDVPPEMPATRVDHAGDMDSSPNAALRKVTGGDVFVHNLYERPFNADTMDKYFPYVDIVDVQAFKDDNWGYATITLAGTDASDSLPAQYAVELDLDRDARGDWLIRATAPASTQWTTSGVQAWKNTDGDIGGVAVMTADTKPRGGNGYEYLIFDEGHGALIDGAWARINANDPKTVEIAFKLSMIGGPNSYAMGAWAGTSVDPAMFDYHDHMTHLQAGSPNPGYEVYPLKAMSEIDNTCRLAIKFAPTGKELGLCATVTRPEPEVPGPQPTEDPGPIIR